MKRLILLLPILILIGCASAYIDNNTNQFIVAFSSENPEQLRKYAEIYDERASDLWRNSKYVRRNGSATYDKYRQWARLLNRKADMIDSGEFYQHEQ